MPSRRDLTFTLSTAKDPESAESDESAVPTGSPALRFLVLGDFSRQNRMPGAFKSRRVTFDNSMLFWHYAVAQACAGLAIVHAFPRLVG